ncbi:7-carboxy-7-deazaguanine synthase, Cx14CxxC type [Allochromatium warmingii]|uniref:7-carboxy-7-deazaguanine synthase n=1 Tax=Allochromatium warmingii TaxID=61595 RepID=A0A1H3DAY2_ALLWA|nr:7-carboxy-7-deazaguanine synthase [Allochromatium warmingii]SDX63517.1 7-carboxy-7-deazaguanine synthase, Cx14CxxC type [Allochromatium warmingii]
MAYWIKECFYSLQGEGAQSGRAAVFCRFSGCNLWSGREQDRARARCPFCDTDFRGTDGSDGGRYASAAALADRLWALWTAGADTSGQPYVVCTGGEPLLQLDAPLIDALHRHGFTVAVETNGTRPIRSDLQLDWICVSPKAGAPLRVTAGDELKLVYPQAGLDPTSFAALDFRQFWLQPCDGPQHAAHTQLALDYCLAHPRWRLSLQTHKLLGIR